MIGMVKALRAEGLAITRTRFANGIEVAACMESMTKQRREGEANGPRGQRPDRASQTSPTWKEFVRLAHQAVVAIAGTGITNRAEPRACGLRRISISPDSELGYERNASEASNEAGNSLGRAPHERAGASNRTGENSPSGMIRGGGGNDGKTRWPFATLLERADTSEAIGLNRVAPPLYSTGGRWTSAFVFGIMAVT